MLSLSIKCRLVGVDVKLYEIDGIIAYATNSTSEVNTADIIRVLRGNVNGFDSKMASDLYNNSDGGSMESLGNLMESVISGHPEVVEGLKIFIAGYSTDGTSLTKEEFINFHSDIYVSSSVGYQTCFGG